MSQASRASLHAVNSHSIQLDIVVVIRVFFLGASAAVIFIWLIPALRDRFLAYGARSSSYGKPGAQQEKETQQDSRAGTPFLLDKIQTWRVPHSWFISFYIVSVTLSVFWLITLPMFRHRLANLEPYTNAERPSTPFSRLLLAVVLLLIQGSRRLAECLAFQAPSSSTMWVGHWLLGIGFYVGMSVAIWIEGLPTLLEHGYSIHDIETEAPTLRTASALLLFTFASGVQHDCHAYLASLKTVKTARPTQTSSVRNGNDNSNSTQPQYQMPTHPAFSATVTPHYLAECLIYSSLTTLAAPTDYWLNLTLLCATVFVTVNLGVTAVGTRAWYVRTFGAKAVQGKWAMIPFVL